MLLVVRDFFDVIQVITGAITSLGVVASIWIAIFQIKKNNRLFKSQIFSNVYQRLDKINELAYKDPEISKNYYKTYNEKTDKNAPFNSYVDIVKSFFYEIYYHHKNGLLNEDELPSWENTIKAFFKYPYVRDYWEKSKSEYGYKFHTYIDDLLKSSN